MAWWIPLMTAAASMMQKNSQEESAKNNRLRYYGGADRTGGNGMMSVGQSSSLLSSVFGIDNKKGKQDNLGLDKVSETGMGARLRLEDMDEETYGRLFRDNVPSVASLRASLGNTIGGAFYDL